MLPTERCHGDRSAALPAALAHCVSGARRGTHVRAPPAQAGHTAGQLFIAAAGNKRQNNDVVLTNRSADVGYPSTYQVDNVIAVAAMETDGLFADWFSNYGR